ncbi:MAG: SIMPL domain-containing protein [Asticcacaulis sp.]|nr:SIMPL domain-containing protein [Asticcacaulis sp.]
MINPRLATGALAILALISDAASARPVRAQAVVPASAPVPVSASPYDKAPWWMRESVIAQTGYVYTELPANRATFSATFLAVDDTVEKAQAKAIQQTKALQQTLARLGKDSVRVTTGFSMRALYEQYRDKNGNRVEDQRGDKINGYQVSLNVSLEVRDMAALEKAYALVLAASPAQTNPIYFSLQPTNQTNTWLYTEAVKDARKRAADATDAAGGRLGGIKVVDPTGRACKTDILARNAADDWSAAQANEVDGGARYEARAMAPPPPPAPAMAMDGAEALEAKALANPFIQTPPLQRLEATACVVYGLN